MVSRFLTPFGGRPPAEQSDTFLELPHEMGQMTEGEVGGRFLAMPRLDVHEADNMIEMTAEIPGVSENDVEISLDGDILTIAGEKRDTRVDKKAHFCERTYGMFQRSIQLPFAPDPARVEANAENGVLTIRFPRSEPERQARIPIGATKTGSQPATSTGRKAIGGGWPGEKAPESAKDELKLTEDQARKGHGAPA